MAARLSRTQQFVLLAIASGSVLKSHRDLDGGKAYLLHPPKGKPKTIRPQTVERLRSLGLIDSNKKFPVATFWLTNRGEAVVAARTF